MIALSASSKVNGCKFIGFAFGTISYQMANEIHDDGAISLARGPSPIRTIRMKAKIASVL
jgi:hypothetical protein